MYITTIYTRHMIIFKVLPKSLQETVEQIIHYCRGGNVCSNSLWWKDRKEEKRKRGREEGHSGVKGQCIGKTLEVDLESGIK